MAARRTANSDPDFVGAVVAGDIVHHDLELALADARYADVGDADGVHARDAAAAEYRLVGHAHRVVSPAHRHSARTSRGDGASGGGAAGSSAGNRLHQPTAAAAGGGGGAGGSTAARRAVTPAIIKPRPRRSTAQHGTLQRR